MLLGPAVDGRGGVVTVWKCNGDRALPPVLMPNVSGVDIIAVSVMLQVISVQFSMITGYFQIFFAGRSTVANLILRSGLIIKYLNIHLF